jgi:CBS domain-containing protein
MHRLRSILERQQVITAPPDATVQQVSVTMTRAHIGAIPIVDEGRLIGVFSERDLMTRVVVAGRDPHATRVSEVMTTEVETATLEEHVDFCVEKMMRVGCRHLPVVVDGKVVGVVSMRDLLSDELAEQDHEIRSLRAYLHQTPL